MPRPSSEVDIDADADIRQTVPCVHVLLSTWNGARYLQQQLDSVLAQDYPRLRVWIRDDGSTDDTPQILERYARADDRLRWTRGDNSGVVRSYFELLESVHDARDLYALCDQDDVWLPGKIAAGVAWLQARPRSTLALYCSALSYVDADLNPIRTSQAPRHIGFGNALIDNVVTGCTAMFGDALRALSVTATPRGVQMHDWWLYLLASAYGEVGFDPQPHILYRQHGSNASAWEANSLRRTGRRLRLLAERQRLGRPRLSSLDQAEKLLQDFPPLRPDQAELLEMMLRFRSAGSLPERLRLALSRRVRHNQPAADIAWRLLLMMRWH